MPLNTVSERKSTPIDTSMYRNIFIGGVAILFFILVFYPKAVVFQIVLGVCAIYILYKYVGVQKGLESLFFMLSQMLPSLLLVYLISGKLLGLFVNLIFPGGQLYPYLPILVVYVLLLSLLSLAVNSFWVRRSGIFSWRRVVRWSAWQLIISPVLIGCYLWYGLIHMHT